MFFVKIDNSDSGNTNFGTFLQIKKSFQKLLLFFFHSKKQMKTVFEFLYFFAFIELVILMLFRFSNFACLFSGRKSVK